MRVLVYGIGGVGGFFGGRIAKAGYETVFFARGKHLEAIKQNGLTVKSHKGNFHATPALATDNLEKVGKVDLILLGVKSWQVEEVAKTLRPVLHKNTVVIPLQNGADNADKLLKILNKKHVVGGLCRIISFIESPGVISHPAFEPQIIFGELDNTKTPRLNNIKEVFDAAGFDNKIADNIQLDSWKKFMFIATISGIGALTRMPIDVLRSNPYLKQVMIDTAQEIKTIANAKNIDITQQDIDSMFMAIDKQAPGTTASMQRDIMDGKPSELENFNGYIVKQGQQLHIETPVNSFIYNCLVPMEKKARKHEK